jgi:hypothetical protein
MLESTHLLEFGLVKLRGISPLLFAHRSAFHLLQDRFVVDVCWGPDRQSIPPSFGQFVNTVKFIVEVDIFVFGSLIRERTTHTLSK